MGCMCVFTDLPLTLSNTNHPCYSQSCKMSWALLYLLRYPANPLCGGQDIVHHKNMLPMNL